MACPTRYAPKVGDQPDLFQHRRPNPIDVLVRELLVGQAIALCGLSYFIEKAAKTK